ncbi:MAG: hypothetical protein NT166_00260 [Candidatus Aminicenantes bacterium]|nr:hypothetical protein [Candidatus Aminicenantes bacterium]
MKFQNWCTIGICCFLIQCFLFASGPQKAIALKDIYKTGKIEFVPVLKISKESVPADIPFKCIFSVCWVHHQLYLLDSLCSNIKVFTVDGRFVKVFGKEGSRESELGFPFRMNVINGLLVVWEGENHRFSIFNLNGTFKHTLQPFKKGKIENFDSLGNGNLVIERAALDSVGDNIYRLVLIELYSKEFQLIKVLYRKQILQFRVFKTPGEKIVYMPFQPEVSWHILPGNDGKNTNKLVIGYSDTYSIDIIDTETGISRTFTHPYSPVKVDDTDRNKYFKSFAKHDKEGNVTVQGADRFTIDNTSFPEYKPVFKRLITDYDGNILVFTYTGSDKAKSSYIASEFDAFEANGQFIDHVKIAHDAEIPILHLFSEKDLIFWGLSSETGIPVGITKYTVK